MKGKYCCFLCPDHDYSEKSLDDLCPKCHRPYGFILDNPPEKIGQYRIIESLARGFYGATFVAERSFLERKYVIKITPVNFYNFFNKSSFVEEVKLHGNLARNSRHIVDILDAFEAEKTIIFTDAAKTQIPCYITVLEFINGQPLQKYIDGTIKSSAPTICQIVIDLLLLRLEFENNRLNHNDLHAENLMVENLEAEKARHDAVDDKVRVLAIDLGSLSDESKSTVKRPGDLSFIATHIDALLTQLLKNPDASEDRYFRIALALQGIINGLQANPHHLRLNPADLIAQIREAYHRPSRPWRPWKRPLDHLETLSDHYNALTLDSWNVPRLLVDPDNRWLAEMARSGPQIITGMRGCGKTMLLKALDIHARLIQRENESTDKIFERIGGDRFVGLFMSAQRLLDLKSQSLFKLEQKLTRLFIGYALEAVRALMHLKDLYPSIVEYNAHEKLALSIADYIEGDINLSQSVSLDDLEQKLRRILVLTIRGDEKYMVSQAPAEVFPHLAAEFRECSELFQNSSVFFLLDDVSTRYLELDKIETLLSALLFQHPICAFKFTSEWQTIELGLKSPGRNHPIRIDRDLTIFDLGEDVFKLINTPGGKGKKFVSRILQQRAELYASHPSEQDPEIILGDESLEQVAREIASSRESSSIRKRIYRGLSCLTNVCVGDIGDVIKLYEEIIKRSGSSGLYPISSDIQSKCFQELSSRRLYDLNRRADYFKDHALAFAEAAHDLLVRSQRTGKKSKSTRLRQYSSIYVRITEKDEKGAIEQIDELRKLIDAGVFVFSGGAPRTKTKDSNPIQQFILSYRKIYGLTAHMGLADRDRFELSGSDLRQWLDTPKEAKTILLRNQIRDETDEAQLNKESAPISEPEGEDLPPKNTFSISTPASLPKHTRLDAKHAPAQYDLFTPQPVTNHEIPVSDFLPTSISVSIKSIDNDKYSDLPIRTVFTGLGFEDRTLESNTRLAKSLKPACVYALRYPVEGYAAKIIDLWRKKTDEIQELDSKTALIDFPDFDGLTLVDVSGLAKPFIFKAVRTELLRKGRVLVSHGTAIQHYPLQEDLSELLTSKKSDIRLFLDGLAKILKGEKGPYKNLKLLDDRSDPTVKRALLAFASPKHERLFSLLDEREFDQIEIIAPKETTPRAEVSKYIAEFQCQDYQNAKVEYIGTDDLESLVAYLDKQYLNIYNIDGANLEIGLTGSKIQAIAAAILSATRKISQMWYLSPKEYDEARFSRGFGELRIFDISLRNF